MLSGYHTLDRHGIGMARYRTDPEHLERIVEVRFVRAGGPGGQHRNKTETGVQLTHPPSGLVVTATERRSQSQNRSVAFQRLTAKLEALNHRPKVRRATKPTRSSQRKRVEKKRKRSALKQGRRTPGSED